MDNLSKTDELILITILRLQDNAYGVTIRRKIEELSGRLYGYGTLYSALEQLLLREYVTKHIGEPLRERGGRRRHYYIVTKLGAEALKSADEMHRELWAEINYSTVEK